MNLQLPRIYPITDVRLSGLSHTKQLDGLIAGGATLIQLREKQASPRDFYESAEKAIGASRASGVPVIINDRVDIALLLGSAGVHLGQNDLPPEKARSILGDEAVIGYSTHSVEQARHARALPVDYIAIGPIFVTSTKQNPDHVVGLDGLRAVREAAGDIPVVAIGGIDAGNVVSVLEAGADSAAIIGALVSDGAAIARRMEHLASLVGS